jgi:hypothetical protein
MPTDIEKEAEKIAKAMGFMVPFAQALVKIKEAVAEKRSVSLTADEAKAVMEAFQLLKEKNAARPNRRH